MGRSKSWTAEENEVLAKAWIAASEQRSEIDGAGKESSMFWDLVLDEIRNRMPMDSDKITGRYSMRALSAIKSHWNDKVKNNSSKFNTSLMLIYRSNPTGSTRQQMVNMAVAMHLGKTSKMEYQYRDIDPNEWINYKAWCHLRHHHKFSPPPPPSTASSSTDEDGPGAAAGDDGCEDTSTINSNNNFTNNFLFSPSGNNNDGRASVGAANSAPVPSVVAPPLNTPASANGKQTGRGRNAAKAQLALEEHRKKKYKAMKELTEVQKRRLQSQNSYMKFTVLKWQIENTTNMEKLVYYHGLMDKIMEELMAEESITPPLAQTMETQPSQGDDTTHGEYYSA